MNTHTPGPWRQVGFWVEHESDNVADICSCRPDDYGQGHFRRPNDEAFANARLIAAAPDLYEAAQAARTALSELLTTRDPKVYADALRLLDAALEKVDAPNTTASGAEQ